jgi:hypothetical protein
MIPRHREPPPLEPSNVPTDAPRIEHSATDWTFLLTTGWVETFTITDGDGDVIEEDDFYVLSRTDSHIEVMKASIAMVSIQARTYETDPPEWVPPVV